MDAVTYKEFGVTKLVKEATPLGAELIGMRSGKPFNEIEPDDSESTLFFYPIAQTHELENALQKELIKLIQQKYSA